MSNEITPAHRAELRTIAYAKPAMPLMMSGQARIERMWRAVGMIPGVLNALEAAERERDAAREQLASVAMALGCAIDTQEAHSAESHIDRRRLEKMLAFARGLREERDTARADAARMREALARVMAALSEFENLIKGAAPLSLQPGDTLAVDVSGAFDGGDVRLVDGDESEVGRG